jgi:hypothetical protein
MEAELFRELARLTASFHRVKGVEEVFDGVSSSFVTMVLVEDKERYLTLAALAGNVDSLVIANCLRDDFDPGALEAVAAASSGGWIHSWLTSCMKMLTPLDLCKVLVRLYKVGYVTLETLYLWKHIILTRKKRTVSKLKSLDVRMQINRNEIVLGRRPLRRKLSDEYVPK